jgi:hypothetical protein
VKPPLCLAGIAAFQAVSQLHHGPCIAARGGLFQTEIQTMPRPVIESH